MVRDSRLFVLTSLAATWLSAAAVGQSGTWINSTSGTYNWSDATDWQGGVVADGAGNTANFTTPGLTGPVVVNLDSPRTLGNLVFDNPTNSYGWTIGGTNPLTLSSSAAGGPRIAVNNSTITATITAPVSAPAGWTKAGPGTLTLAGPTAYAGGITVAAGTLAVKGAAIAGDYLDGSGTVTTDPTNGGRLVNVTSSPSVEINSNSANDVFRHFTIGGTLTVAPGTDVDGTSTVVNFDGVTIQGTGTLTVGANGRINVANLQSSGTLVLTPRVGGNAQRTWMTNLGSSPLGFGSGSRTFISTLHGSGQDPAVLDLHGQNAIVAGGLFLNNGFVGDSTASGATIVADYGALVKGAGVFQNNIITQNGGRFQAGNSPGMASFGSLLLGPGGIDNYVLAINDATGTAGPSPDASGHVSGWGLIRTTTAAGPPDLGFAPTSGDFTWTATPAARLTVSLQTLLNPTTPGEDIPGPMAHFDPARKYVWPAVEWAGAYTGPSEAAALDAATAFDTTGVLNPIAGTFGWSLDQSGRTLSIVYTPVPEPSSLLLVAAGGVFAALIRRRRR
jgi:autotransporter-associated beta strand protein